MNMSNEILKIKSDYEYVSQSENYIVFVSNTFINVFLFNKFTFVPLVPDIQSLLLFLYNPFYLILSLFFLYKL